VPSWKKIRHRFWMAYVDEEAMPRHKHYERKDAMKEAERLAKQTGKDVFILEATCWARYTPPIPQPPPGLVWNPITPSDC
jgi:hypothetical protein